jgi:hypothetical protein
MQSRRYDQFAIVLIALAGAAVGALRGPLNTRFTATRIQHDVFALPPPGQMVTMSLGYRSALADLIFAHVLVSSGIHLQEKREFEFVGNYLETVNALDPKFEMPYRLADTLLTLQVKRVGAENFREAKRILERGMAEFPLDQALWESAGQFFAYLGPSVFDDPKEQQEWMLAGGRTLAHACELVGSDENIPYHCVVAAGLLTKAGADAASLQFLERMKIVSDDPEIQRFVDAMLSKAKDAERDDRAPAHHQAFQAAWGTDLPFVTRGALLAIGPNWDPADCASLNASCSTSWRAWGEAVDRPLGATGTEMP